MRVFLKNSQRCRSVTIAIPADLIITSSLPADEGIDAILPISLDSTVVYRNGYSVARPSITPNCALSSLSEPYSAYYCQPDGSWSDHSLTSSLSRLHLFLCLCRVSSIIDSLIKSVFCAIISEIPVRRMAHSDKKTLGEEAWNCGNEVCAGSRPSKDTMVSPLLSSNDLLRHLYVKPYSETA